MSLRYMTRLCRRENYSERDTLAGLRCVSPLLQRLMHIGEFSGTKTEPLVYRDVEQSHPSPHSPNEAECICGKYQENGTDPSV